MAGFLGLLLFVLLLGIRLLIFHQSPSDLICLLQVFGFLGFYVLDLFSSASSSHVFIRLLWFRPALSRSLGSLGLILGLVLVLR